MADRFRRVWHLVEHIAANSGHSRRELADLFHLSERQVQADLNIIRIDMGLPLVRKQGYRFADEGTVSAAGVFNLHEAQLLVAILRRAMSDRSIPAEQLASLLDKVPNSFPPHLRPLVTRTLEAVTARRGRAEQQVFAALSDALLTGAYVRLSYPSNDLTTPFPDPVIRPEYLLPYLGGWYAIGECRQKQRVMMFDLTNVAAVTLEAAPEPSRADRVATAVRSH